MQDSPSLYGEDDSSSDTPPADQSGEYNGKDTAVLPAELCPGMKVGDEIKLKIVSADEDSYEVAYEPKKDESPGEEEAPQATVPPGSADSMME